jgi:hypothetical protein
MPLVDWEETWEMGWGNFYCIVVIVTASNLYKISSSLVNTLVVFTGNHPHLSFWIR